MKFCWKSFTTGLVTAAACTTACVAFASGSIETAVFNDNKVVLDGAALDLSGTPLISVVKEGETDASNYMPVRGVLEAMGYDVGWDAGSKSVIVTSKGNADADADMPSMPNPWEICTEAEAFAYLDAGFEFNPPDGFELAEIAALSAQFTDTMGESARFAYTDSNDDMYRVHIFKDAAKNLPDQGDPVQANGVTVYYDEEQSSIAYAQNDYMISIDMLGKSKAELLETAGSVTIIP